MECKKPKTSEAMIRIGQILKANGCDDLVKIDRMFVTYHSAGGKKMNIAWEASDEL